MGSLVLTMPCQTVWLSTGIWHMCLHGLLNPKECDISHQSSICGKILDVASPRVPNSNAISLSTGSCVAMRVEKDTHKRSFKGLSTPSGNVAWCVLLLVTLTDF